MSSPQVKKLFYNKSNFKTDEDFSNECSHSNKKTMTTFYGNNESINYNKTFFSKKNLKFNKEIDKKENAKSSSKIEGLSNATFYIRKINKLSTIDDHTFYVSNNYIPYKNVLNNNNNNDINSHYDKSDIIQSLDNNKFIPIDILDRNDKNSILLNSQGYEDIYNEGLTNNKCNYIYLKYNEKDNKSKKNKKIDINKFINAINMYLMPKDKTFESIEKLINYRIISKESLKSLNNFCLLNDNIELRKNKIIKIIFIDIIKKVIKRMLKKGHRDNSLINKYEIKKEYFNQINILKKKMNLKKKNSNKNYLKSSSERKHIKSKSIKKINLKYSFNKYKKNKDNSLLSNTFYKKKIFSKNNSYDNHQLHYYDFNDASKEIKKQYLKNEKIAQKINSNYINPIPLNNRFISNIKFSNTFNKNSIGDKSGKNIENIFNKNFNKEIDNNKMLNQTDNDTDNINLVKNLQNYINDEIINNEKKENNNNNSYQKKKNFVNSFNHVSSMDNIISIKEKNKIKSLPQCIEQNNKNNISKKIFNINNLNKINDKKNKNKFKLKVMKNNDETFEEKTSISQNINLIGFLHENRKKNYIKNNDIMNLFLSKKEKEITIKEDNKVNEEESEIKVNISNTNNTFINENEDINKNININNKINDIKNNNNKLINQDSDIILNKEENNNYVKNLFKEFSLNYTSNNNNDTKNSNIDNNTNNKNNINNKKQILKKQISFKYERNQKLKIRNPIKYKSISYFLKGNKKNLISKKEKNKVLNKEINYKKIHSDINNNIQLIGRTNNEKLININKINEEDNKKSNWENRFDIFKNYIKKLKNMSNEEFVNDTLKFIKNK